ncbi:unnamed protein product [Cuscuta epithymum]|uniref:Retrotransposon Copia-like N-terminal domain-containing protein n=1 Tax=Cuscuta epithymum TaxID=186058 RepID=A0AAV0CXM2_9ASTE|nr:unnamed protein product [Cuscuta epithymum]CAH9124843.1 unnamed protein product [Cuscuta epithymum]
MPDNQNLTEDPSSPYYLHPADHSGVRIIYEMFNGDNYNAWQKSVVMAFTVKNKMAFIDGTISQPSSDDPLYLAWYRVNALLLSWLVYSIIPEIRTTFLYFTVAKDVWEEVKLRYGKSDGPHVFQLEKSLTNLSQGSQSLTAFYNFFKTLWDEYCNYRTPPVCKCGNCTCNLNELYQELLQRDSVYKFLIGLNESYNVLRSQILLKIPIPKLSTVYSLLLQEESQRSLHNPTESVAMLSQHIPNTQSQSIATSSNTESLAFIAKSNPKKKYTGICSHCGFQGHSSERCYQLIGYPANWKGPKGQRFAPGFKPSSTNANKSSQAHLASTSTDSPDLDLCNPELYNLFLQFMKNQSSLSSSAHAAMTMSQSPGPQQSSSPDNNAFKGPKYTENHWLC